MSATAITIKRLLAVSGVTDLVGTQVFPTVVAAEKAMPAIAVTLSGQGDGYNMSGADHFPRSKVTVTSFGRSAREADRIGEAVEAGLKDFRGSVSLATGTYHATYFKDSNDGAFYEDLVEQYRRSSDYILHWR